MDERSHKTSAAPRQRVERGLLRVPKYSGGVKYEANCLATKARLKLGQYNKNDLKHARKKEKRKKNGWESKESQTAEMEQTLRPETFKH